MIAYLLIRLATWLTRVLPLRVQLALADGIAAVGWTVLPAMHGRVRANVRTILGSAASQAEVERVARQQWRNYLHYMRDFAALPHSAEACIDEILSNVQGFEHLQAAMDLGRGLALVSVHFGNWDLAAGAVARHFRVNAIADTFSSGRVDQAVNERRDALGLQVIPIERVVKRIVAAFRRKEVVAFLVDKPVLGDDGVEVTFFGRATRIPAGAAFFAARAGAPMVMGFVWRAADGRLTAKVLPPIEVDSDPRVTMQRVMSQAEQHIRAYPEYWYMFRNMWPALAEDEAVRPQMEEAVA